MKTKFLNDNLPRGFPNGPGFRYGNFFIPRVEKTCACQAGEQSKGLKNSQNDYGPKLGQKCQKFKNLKKVIIVKCLVFQLTMSKISFKIFIFVSVKIIRLGEHTIGIYL